MLSFVFYSHLKMNSKRSKNYDFLALSFITKSISKKLFRTVKSLKQTLCDILSSSLSLVGFITG